MSTDRKRLSPERVSISVARRAARALRPLEAPALAQVHGGRSGFENAGPSKGSRAVEDGEPVVVDELE